MTNCKTWVRIGLATLALLLAAVWFWRAGAGELSGRGAIAFPVLLLATTALAVLPWPDLLARAAAAGWLALISGTVVIDAVIGGSRSWIREECFVALVLWLVLRGMRCRLEVGSPVLLGTAATLLAINILPPASLRVEGAWLGVVAAAVVAWSIEDWKRPPAQRGLRDSWLRGLERCDQNRTCYLRIGRRGRASHLQRVLGAIQLPGTVVTGPGPQFVWHLSKNLQWVEIDTGTETETQDDSSLLVDPGVVEQIQDLLVTAAPPRYAGVLLELPVGGGALRPADCLALEPLLAGTWIHVVVTGSVDWPGISQLFDSEPFRRFAAFAVRQGVDGEGADDLIAEVHRRWLAARLAVWEQNGQQRHTDLADLTGHVGDLLNELRQTIHWLQMKATGSGGGVETIVFALEESSSTLLGLHSRMLGGGLDQHAQQPTPGAVRVPMETWARVEALLADIGR